VYFIIIAICGAGVARGGEDGGDQFNAPPNGQQSRGIA